MTTFLRFFLLTLTPLLGVTLSLGSAFFFGITTLLVLGAVAALNAAVRPRLKATAVLWSNLGLAVVVVTLVDTVTTLWLPGLRAAWGLYLNLLAFLPLVIVMPLERPDTALTDALTRAGQWGLLFTGLLTVTALVREVLGQGTLTLFPSSDPPLRGDWPFSVFATGAGGFFLAAAAVVAFRVLRPRLGTVPFFAEPEAGPTPAGHPPTPVAPAPAPKPPAPSPRPPAKTPVKATVPVPATEAALESIDQWGEDLPGTVLSLATGGDRARLLVIGSGNGELTYYLAMLALERSKALAGDRDPGFKVRGVDHFSTRVETAQRGVYREHQVEFIPKALRDAWLTRGTGDEKHLWKVGPEARGHVQFEVADFQNGPLFFPLPAHIIVLNQGIEYVSDEKKRLLLKTVCDNLVVGGALVVPGAFKRELLPEGMKRTGTSVFRKG